MKGLTLMALALIIGGSLSARPQSRDEATLGLSAVRYYRATPAAVQTLVDVFCRVPLTLVSPLGGREAGRRSGSPWRCGIPTA